MMMMGGMGGSSPMGMMDMMTMGGGSMPSMSSGMAGAIGQMGDQMSGQMGAQMSQLGGQMGQMGGQMSQIGGQMGQMGAGGYGSMYGMADPGTMGNLANQGAAQGFGGFGTNGIGARIGNLDFNSVVTGLLNFGIKLFFVLLLVGLAAGAVVFLKRYLLSNPNGNTATVSAANKGLTCVKCDHILQTEWMCCPKCGERKAPAAQLPVTLSPQTV